MIFDNVVNFVRSYPNPFLIFVFYLRKFLINILINKNSNHSIKNTFLSIFVNYVQYSSPLTSISLVRFLKFVVINTPKIYGCYYYLYISKCKLIKKNFSTNFKMVLIMWYKHITIYFATRMHLTRVAFTQESTRHVLATSIWLNMCFITCQVPRAA